MNDLDRLLEKAEKAKSVWAPSGIVGRDAEFIVACDPDTIIGLIERVKQLERQLDDCDGALRGAEGR